MAARPMRPTGAALILDAVSPPPGDRSDRAPDDDADDDPADDDHAGGDDGERPRPRTVLDVAVPLVVGAVVAIVLRPWSWW